MTQLGLTLLQMSTAWWNVLRLVVLLSAKAQADHHSAEVGASAPQPPNRRPPPPTPPPRRPPPPPPSSRAPEPQSRPRPPPSPPPSDALLQEPRSSSSSSEMKVDLSHHSMKYSTLSSDRNQIKRLDLSTTERRNIPRILTRLRRIPTKKRRRNNTTKRRRKKIRTSLISLSIRSPTITPLPLHGINLTNTINRLNLRTLNLLPCQNHWRHTKRYWLSFIP